MSRSQTTSWKRHRREEQVQVGGGQHASLFWGLLGLRGLEGMQMEVSTRDLRTHAWILGH